jgi:hypothetical protein
MLTYDIDSQVGGRVAAVGQRLLESSAKSITRQGLEGLAREIAAMGESETVAAPTAPVTPLPPPVQLTQAELAARVASDVARDLVPPERRPWVIGGGLLALAVIILLLMKACG